MLPRPFQQRNKYISNNSKDVMAICQGGKSNDLITSMTAIHEQKIRNQQMANQTSTIWTSTLTSKISPSTLTSKFSLDK